ncbi:hypothetical protein [Actinophytocola sp.]|uniref:hypothetical protein n=1 Tax=Actinophytocola sp. TaxID=1872138 RepID=UPI00389A2BCE
MTERPACQYPAEVDAIIVPTARNAAMLDTAIALASKLDSTLVALCSKYSTAQDVVTRSAGEGVRLVAIDVEDMPDGVVPAFDTCRVLAGTRFERRTDTSLKRNLGLLLSRLIGWRRIVFLDDDIKVPEPMDLRDAVGMTDHYAGVGLVIDQVEGMPDNSVVCHAFREAGGEQDVFIGGGALAIGTASMTSFFPNIYNEDWFFLLDDDGLRPTATTGTAVQKVYDPFREDRARMEELGDCLAEGLFWLLDNGRSLRDATERHWRTFLDRRVGFITDVIDMVTRMDGDPELRHRMRLSLKAARGRCHYIRPELCVRYVEAWRADRVRWRRHLADLDGLRVPRVRGSRPTVDEVRTMFRSLDFPDRVVQIRLPAQQLLDQDAADLDVPFPVALRE